MPSLTSRHVATFFCALLLFGLFWPIPARAVEVQRTGSSVKIVSPTLRIECDLARGQCDYIWSEGNAIRGAACTARLIDGREITTENYPIRECAGDDVTPLADALGTGAQVVLHYRGPNRPELRQTLRVYDDKPFCSVEVAIINETPLSSNNIAPIACDAARTPNAGAHLDTGERPRTLFVPFDNDMFVRYNSEYAQSSHEVTAIYDNASRHGFVIGSLTHDLWKTGMAMNGHGPQTVGQLRVYGGMTGHWTHDKVPHGYVSGTTITSPRLFVGYFPDWRDGLETYGRASATLMPALPWEGGVIFGWNSWSAYGKDVSFDKYMAASEFVKTQLQTNGFGDAGNVYVNVDSFWDNMTPLQLTEATGRIHANGQKAGIYWTPFTYWGDDMARKVEGSNGLYTYDNILLKDATGQMLPKLDGGHPLDPSHPGTLARIDWQLQQFINWGYDFVKLDFINAGALEGVHYDPRITTGIAAYNLGMQRIVANLSPPKVGRPFFICLSIAPLFPSQYAHSRRIACDTFAALKDSEYMLNAQTYGWWTNNTLYRFNDPDHVVLTASEAEARTRVNSSVIAGTMMLDSDDLTNPKWQERTKTLLTNPRINDLARKGLSFRSTEGDTGEKAANVFVGNDGTNTYIAAFNFDDKAPLEKELDLARLGLDAKRSYQMRALWTGQTEPAQGKWKVTLAPAESKIWQVATVPAPTTP